MLTRYWLCIVLLAGLGCGGSESASNPDAGSADAGPVSDGSTSPSLLGPCSIEKRRTSDQTLLYRETRSYDADGRLRTLQQDGGGLYWEAEFDDDDLPDGVIERIYYYTYDEQGRTKLIERDDGVDGTIEVVQYYSYDAATNRLLYYLTDANIQDGFQPTSQWNYRYDDAGHVVETVHDSTPDTTIDFSKATDTGLNHQWRYEYDEAGRQSSATFDRLFDACDNFKITHVYDETGRVVREDIDGNSQLSDCTTSIVDGTIDLTVHVDYDDQGRLWQRRYDDGNDGSIDRREERSFECP